MMKRAHMTMDPIDISFKAVIPIIASSECAENKATTIITHSAENAIKIPMVLRIVFFITFFVLRGNCFLVALIEIFIGIVGGLEFIVVHSLHFQRKMF